MKIAILQTIYCATVDDLITIDPSTITPGEKRFAEDDLYVYYPNANVGVKPSSITDDDYGRWIKKPFDVSILKVEDDTFDFESTASVDVTNSNTINILSKLGIAFTLEELKRKKFDDINTKSGELIREAGHTYGGKVFSLKETAQLNVLGAERKKDVAALYPIVFNTMDDMDELSLENATELNDFFMSALATKKSILDSGTALKRLVRSATTKAEIDLVIDNR